MSDARARGSDAAGDTDPKGMMEAVVAQHQAALLRYAGRLLNDGAAAQDVVQEAFLRLHRALACGRGPAGAVSHWLYRTTHNAAVDWIRRESRLRRLHEEHAEELEVRRDGAADEQAVRDERRRVVLRHLSRLKPAERQVLVLRLQEGMSYADIGRVTGRSEGYVGCLLHHATRKLAAHLRKAGVI